MPTWKDPISAEYKCDIRCRHFSIWAAIIVLIINNAMMLYITISKL